MTVSRKREGDRWLRQAERDMQDAALARRHERYNLAAALRMGEVVYDG